MKKCFTYIFLKNNNDNIITSNSLIALHRNSHETLETPSKKRMETEGSKARRSLGGGHPKFPERPWEQVRTVAKRG